jgi:hypothetical protein
MGLTAADRQRRYRQHAKGDHSLCDPERRCDAVTGVTLGPRGSRLYREMTAGPKLGPAQMVLLEEACRLADRLDTLDRFLSGDSRTWLRFFVDDTGTEVTVTIDNVLSEARQQAVALKQLLSELRQATAAKPGTPAAGKTTAKGAGIADLTARIAAARRADAAG